MIRVGLTGGIGSGKTTVARVFRALGIPVFEADVEGRRLLAEDHQVINAIESRFGPQVLQGGVVDRAVLATIVFKNADALIDLNAIVHPAVRESFRRWTDQQQAPYVMMEAAILVESGGYRAMDRIVVVTAPEELRMRRVVLRDGVDVQAVRARMANQGSEADRLAAADQVIHNNDTQLVIPQVLEVHRSLLTFAGR